MSLFLYCWHFLHNDIVLDLNAGFNHALCEIFSPQFTAHLLLPSFSCYIRLMTITQTVDIPESHRLVIDVPHEIPAGRAILAFTPADTVEDECPLCAKYQRDPKTGALPYNAVTLAAMKEAKDIAEGKISAKWYHSVDDLQEALEL